VWVYVLPGTSVPPNDPSFAVTVWVTESWLVQVTVLFTPITTVMELGVNAKFLMVTLAAPCADATGTVRTEKPPADTSAAMSTTNRLVLRKYLRPVPFVFAKSASLALECHLTI